MKHQKFTTGYLGKKSKKALKRKQVSVKSVLTNDVTLNFNLLYQLNFSKTQKYSSDTSWKTIYPSSIPQLS